MKEADHPLERTRARPLMSKTGWEVALICFVVLLYVVPQIQQQLVLDKLPITGDLIHRRVVYFLTNFPNYRDAPTLVLGHSQFYHELIADINILTGLTEDRSFYGMTVVNLALLPLAAFTLYIFARRLRVPYPVLVPLLFLSNPLLVAPFFGHSNQFLIFFSVALFVFSLLFFQRRFPVSIVMLLLLGVVFNSSMVVYLPVLLLLLILDYWYPEHRLLLLASLSVLAFLVFLHPPLGYLLLGDYSASSFGKLALVLLVVTGGLMIYYRLIAPRKKVHKLTLMLVAAVAVGLFLFAREGTPFWRTLQPEELGEAKVSIRSVNIVDYLFSVNSNKLIGGQSINLSIISLLAVFAVYFWFFARRRPQANLSRQLKVIAGVVLLPVAIALARLVLLSFNLDYFSRTALYTLHTGRIMSISFYLAPLFIVYLLYKHTSPIIDKRSTLFIMVGLVMNCVVVSQFFFFRYYPNWTQKSYQTLLQNSLEQGIGENLSAAETTYACRFYGRCSTQGQTDPAF